MSHHCVYVGVITVCAVHVITVCGACHHCVCVSVVHAIPVCGACHPCVWCMSSLCVVHVIIVWGAFLYLSGQVDAIVLEDSDLIVFGCRHLLTDFKETG